MDDPTSWDVIEYCKHINISDPLTLKVLNFWKFTSYCSLNPYGRHGGSSAGLYLADPTSPIPSHCASIVATSTLRVNLNKLSTTDTDMYTNISGS